MINNNELLDIYKLKNIIRYNNKLTITKESVAEHSFFVAMISAKICDILQLSSEIKYETIIKSLLHDMPEIILNDITHDTKQLLNLQPLLDVYEKKYFENNFSSYLDVLYNSKNNEIVNLIVNLSDILSVKQFCLTEMNLGNTTVEIYDVMNDTLQRERDVMKKIDEVMKK